MLSLTKLYALLILWRLLIQMYEDVGGRGGRVWSVGWGRHANIVVTTVSKHR